MSDRKLFSKKQIAQYFKTIFPVWELTGVEHYRTGFLCDHGGDPRKQIDISIDGTRPRMYHSDNLLYEHGVTKMPMHTEIVFNPATNTSLPRAFPLYISEVLRSDPLRVGAPFRGVIRKQFMAGNELIYTFDEFMEMRTWIEMADAAEESWHTLAESLDDDTMAPATYAAHVLRIGMEREVIPHFALPNTRWSKNPQADVPGAPDHFVFLSTCTMGIDTAMIYAGIDPFSARQMDEPVEVPVLLRPEIDEFLESLLR